MRILLVGVSCVGKSTIGKLIAEKLGYKFFDFDFELQEGQTEIKRVIDYLVFHKLY